MLITDNDKKFHITINPYNPRNELDNIGWIQIFKGKHKGYYEQKSIKGFKAFEDMANKQKTCIYQYIFEARNKELYCDVDENIENAVGVIFTSDFDLNNKYSSYTQEEIEDELIEEIEYFNKYLDKDTLKVNVSVYQNDIFITEGTIYAEKSNLKESLMLTDIFDYDKRIIGKVLKKYQESEM